MEGYTNLSKVESILNKKRITPEDSVELCRASGVSEDRIIHNTKELDDFFLGKRKIVL